MPFRISFENPSCHQPVLVKIRSRISVGRRALVEDGQILSPRKIAGKYRTEPAAIFQIPSDFTQRGEGALWIESEGSQKRLDADLLARERGQVAVQTTQLFDYLQPALLHAANEST